MYFLSTFHLFPVIIIIVSEMMIISMLFDLIHCDYRDLTVIARSVCVSVCGYKTEAITLGGMEEFITIY
jgi:hypothetical protein